MKDPAVIFVILLFVWFGLALLFVAALCCAASLTAPRPNAPPTGAVWQPFVDPRSLSGEAAAPPSGGSGGHTTPPDRVGPSEAATQERRASETGSDRHLMYSFAGSYSRTLSCTA